ncbi:hypothetical protein BKA69DRAFT_708707 [Paraphysoderma sedebokerense]|nr:hypothetical protein BKA69DRAFT_708707 [Paraphysoderma sedebokerense]
MVENLKIHPSFTKRYHTSVKKQKASVIDEPNMLLTRRNMPSYTFASGRYAQMVLLNICIAALVITVSGQSRWQDVTTFHPYCVRLFRSCVEASTNTAGGSLGEGLDTGVGICGNKMAICAFSGSLSWPWSTGTQGRPAAFTVDASARLNVYRNALISPPPSTPNLTNWQNLTEFLPDCRAEFRRCVDSSGLNGITQDLTVGMCGHGMSVCTQRLGRWPYGNDSTVFWQQPHTSARLQVYRNVYSSSLGPVRIWQNLTGFLPTCRSSMIQCVAVSGGSSSDVAIGNCGNQMAI